MFKLIFTITFAGLLIVGVFNDEKIATWETKTFKKIWEVIRPK
jgi:hypothetical protein